MTSQVFWSRKIGQTREHPRARDINTKKSVLTKRRKFVLVAISMSVMLYVVQTLPVESRYMAILGLALLSYLLSSWSLIKELRGVAWIADMIIPVLYPISVALFYFLLPQSALTRGVILLLFAISMYGLLLTANIFAVASIRTIQLLRAARTVGFLLSVLTSAFLFHVIFSFNLPIYAVGGLTCLISLLIFMQGIWSYSLGEKITKEEWKPIFVGSAIVSQSAVALCFFLIDAPLASIVLAMMVYVLLGIFQNNVEKRLFARTAQEYLGFALIVIIVAIYSALSRWSS